jgi:thiol-disulfide isomerase/thioredoxin
MFKNFIRGAILYLVLSGSFSAVSAAEWKTYDKVSFEASQKAGHKIIVDIFATWCSTCKAQSKIMAAMKEKGQFDGVALFKVDYDSQKDFLKSHKVPRQSTILVFVGVQEKARIIAETNKKRLSVAILKALQ